MIFGYMRIERVVSHAMAYRLLRHKRMGPHTPNGNIIVNAAGGYNAWDGGDHHHNFPKIREHYAIGDPSSSRFLTEAQLADKAQGFIAVLQRVLGGQGARAIDFITRAGCHELNEKQVEALRRWVDAGLPDEDRGFGGATRGPLKPVRSRRVPSVCGPGGVCVPPVRMRCTPAVASASCGPRGAQTAADPKLPVRVGSGTRCG